MSGEEVPQEDLPNNNGLQEVPPEDLPSQSGSEVPQEDMPQDLAPYTTPGQQIETGIEGAARGITGGLSDALAKGMRGAATKVGVPQEYLHYVAPAPAEMQARQQANPVEAKGSEIAGNVALMSALPEISLGQGALAKIGSTAINGAIQMGGIQTADQVSNYLMGNKTDPSSIPKAAALGVVGGTVFGLLGAGGSKAIQGLGIKGSDKLLSSALTGAGHAAQFPGESLVPLANSALSDAERAGIDPGMFKVGQLMYKYGTPAATGMVAGHLVGNIVPDVAGAGLTGWALKKATALGASTATNTLENYLSKFIPKGITDKVSAAFMNMARSGRTQGIDEILNNAGNIAKGDAIVGKSVKSLFNLAPKEYMDVTADIREKNKLKDIVNEPEPTPMPAAQQGFADGGEVQNQASNPMADMYPELNMAMETAKGRVKGYLKSLRPNENKTRLPYDLNERNPQEHHEYDKVVGLAIRPLSILKKVQNGSLTTKDMTHFTSLYPELQTELRQRIHEQISENRFKDHPKPAYGMRQALSLFLGQDLDSSLSQPVMALAQSTFTAKQGQQQQQGPKEVKSKASLGKIGQSAATPDQARLQRQNEA